MRVLQVLKKRRTTTIKKIIHRYLQIQINLYCSTVKKDDVVATNGGGGGLVNNLSNKNNPKQNKSTKFFL